MIVAAASIAAATLFLANNVARSENLSITVPDLHVGASKEEWRERERERERQREEERRREEERHRYHDEDHR